MSRLSRQCAGHDDGEPGEPGRTGGSGTAPRGPGRSGGGDGAQRPHVQDDRWSFEWKCYAER